MRDCVETHKLALNLMKELKRVREMLAGDIYEYKILPSETLANETKLEAFGMEGWSLVAIVPASGLFYYHLQRRYNATMPTDVSWPTELKEKSG